MHHNNRLKNKILSSYFVTYCTVLIIPLLFCSFYCIHILSAIETDDIQKQKNETLHTAERFDRTLSELSRFADSLISNNEIAICRRDIRRKPDFSTYYLYHLRQNLQNYLTANNFSSDFFIFLSDIETAVNPHVIYSYEDFYNFSMHPARFENFSAWHDYIRDLVPSYGFSASGEFILQKDQTLSRFLIYTRPLYQANLSDRSTLCIFIPEESISNLMPALSENGIQLIRDSRGDVLYFRCGSGTFRPDDILEVISSHTVSPTYSGNAEIMLGNDHYLLTSCNSDTFELEYLFLEPKALINSRRNRNLSLLLTILLIASFTGIALSYYMALKSSSPLNHVLKDLTYTDLNFEDALSLVIRNNSSLKEALASQKPSLQTAFLARMIYGSYMSEDEIIQTAMNLELPTNDRIYWILMFHFHLPSDEITGKSLPLIRTCVLSLQEAVRELLPDNIFSDIKENTPVLLMDAPSGSTGHLKTSTEELIQKLRQKLPAQISDRLIVYGGSFTDSLSGLRESFTNAELMYKKDPSCFHEEIIWYHSTLKNIPKYPPLDISVKLTHFLITGAATELHEYLENIIREYILSDHISPYIQQMLLNELQIILFRTLSQLDIEEKELLTYYYALETHQNSSLPEQLSTTLSLYSTVCRNVYDQKQYRKKIH